MAAPPNWLAWSGATVAGFALGMTSSTFIVGVAARPLRPLLGGIVVVVCYGAVIGLVLGAAQLLTFPRGAVTVRWWTLASLCGAAAAFAAVAVAGELLGNAIVPAVNVIISEGTIEGSAGALAGLTIGTAQWLAMRRLLPRAGWWIAASTAGGAIGYTAATAALELWQVPLFKANMVPSFGAILGLFVGAGQGLVLWSLRVSCATRAASSPAS